VKRQTIEFGATLQFSATFLDAAGNPTAPASADVHLTYKVAGATTRASVAMVNAGGTFTASWDSAVADSNAPVFWNVRSAGAPKASQFGRVDFDWNTAGPPDA
jgi:hypothetical protein